MPGWQSDKSSGLLGHFVGTVEKSWAGTNVNIGDGNVTLIFWETAVDDILQEDFDNVPPDAVNLSIGLGAGWDTDENGILYHEDDPMRKEKGLEPRDFKSSSLYGKIIDLVTGDEKYVGKYQIMDGGPEDVACDFSMAMDYFTRMGYDDPHDPSIWNGIQFEFRGLGFIYRNQDEPRMKAVPVKVVSVPDGKGAGVANRATRPRASKPEPQEEVTYDWSQHGVDDATAANLHAILNDAKTHSAFVKEAMKLDSVKGNQALMDILVSDEGPWSLR